MSGPSYFRGGLGFFTTESNSSSFTMHSGQVGILTSRSFTTRGGSLRWSLQFSLEGTTLTFW